MKKLTVTLMLILVTGFSTFAQSLDPGVLDSPSNLRFEVSGKYSPITKEKLVNANLLNDFIAYYPANWISDYISVEISGTCNGKFMKGFSTNNTLTTEQKNILNTIDLNSDLFIIVEYNNLNSVTNIVEKSSMNVSRTVVPEREAEFENGKHQLIKYLKENAIDKISKTNLKEFQHTIILFTVNEDGEITDVKIPMSSGDPTTDQLLLRVINSMPKWKPAENSEGKKVKQEFKLDLANGGC